MQTVSDNWNVSVETSTEYKGAKLRVFRGFAPSRKTRYGMANGMMFPDQESASRYALEHGYTQVFYRRPNCWFGLRLPRAARRHIAQTGHLGLIDTILPEDPREWYQSHPYDSATPVFYNPTKRAMFADAYKNRNKHGIDCRLEAICQTPCH